MRSTLTRCWWTTWPLRARSRDHPILPARKAREKEEEREDRLEEAEEEEEVAVVPEGEDEEDNERKRIFFLFNLFSLLRGQIEILRATDSDAAAPTATHPTAASISRQLISSHTHTYARCRRRRRRRESAASRGDQQRQARGVQTAQPENAAAVLPVTSDTQLRVPSDAQPQQQSRRPTMLFDCGQLTLRRRTNADSFKNFTIWLSFLHFAPAFFFA